MVHRVHGSHHHCPPPSYYDTGNPRDLMKPIVTNMNIFVDNNNPTYCSTPSVPTWASALSTFTGGLLSGLTFGLLGGKSWGGFGGGWGGFGGNMFGFGRGNLIYDNTLGGQIYSSPQFGAMTLGNYALASTPAATTTTPEAKTEDKKTEDKKTEDPKDSKKPEDKKTEDKKDSKKPDGAKHTPTADELNGLINGDAKGKITGTTSTNDIANTVNNLFAGEKQTEDTKDGDNQAKVGGNGKNKGYLESFTITDASGNIYTLTDPQVDDNGKLTYKIKSASCDLSQDDKGTNKNYELNKAYDEGTRLEVTVENGQVVLYNESGQPIARKQGGSTTATSTDKNTQTKTAEQKNEKKTTTSAKSDEKYNEGKQYGEKLYYQVKGISDPTNTKRLMDKNKVDKDNVVGLIERFNALSTSAATENIMQYLRNERGSLRSYAFRIPEALLEKAKEQGLDSDNDYKTIQNIMNSYKNSATDTYAKKDAQLLDVAMNSLIEKMK